MIRRTACLVTALVALAACASYPAPVQRLADAEATSRTAAEVGANANPKAQLHLTMAQEELASAKKLMNSGDNEQADGLLLRARADADLALAFTRETEAEVGARTAADQLNSAAAQTSSTTVTTSATTTRTTTGGTP